VATDETEKNIGTVRHGDFYEGRVTVIKGSGFVDSIVHRDPASRRRRRKGKSRI
jgi:hypothetical protein